jgi:thioredoxin 1
MRVKNISEIDFEDEVLNDSGIVIVKFYGNWCGPCKMLASILDQMPNINGLRVVGMDVDRNMTIAKQFGVMAVPTMVVFKDGSEVEKITGFRNQAQLQEIFQKYLLSGK